MRAKDLMTKDVATLGPLTDAAEAARFLTERGITGAPVVDAKGNVLGVVSQTDLVRQQGAASGAFWDAPGSGVDWASDPAKTPVMAIMCTRLATCDEETDLADAAALMIERRIHRLVVTRNGRLSGILTAMDLLRAIPASA